MSFAELGLSTPLLKAIAEKGYTTPSPIQLEAIPTILQGCDVMAAAQTGTGKTAGFTLPILDRLNGGNKAKGNQVRALILTPTRELAAQVGESVATYGANLDLRSTVIFGGVKINPQMMRLRSGVDILVATPGRLMDLYQQNAVKFDQLEVLVLDEADRMLDMGFIHDIRKIIALLPRQRQNLLFSATFSPSIRELARGIVNQPVEISVSPADRTATTVKQFVYPVDARRKPLLLMHLIREEEWQQVLVFTKTKRGANRLALELNENGIQAAAIHGNKSQGARTTALAEFKRGKTRVLVATDIAARGLDIEQLPQVVNYELPSVPEDYVHRIGRTGRAGAEGHAISLVCADEFKLLVDIERLIQQVLSRELLPDFIPQRTLPESRLGQRVPKAPSRNNQNRTDTKKGRPPRRNSSARRSGSAARPESDTTNTPRQHSEPGNRSEAGAGRHKAKRSDADKRKPNGGQKRTGPNRSNGPQSNASQKNHAQSSSNKNRRPKQEVNGNVASANDAPHTEYNTIFKPDYSAPHKPKRQSNKPAGSRPGKKSAGRNTRNQPYGYPSNSLGGGSPAGQPAARYDINYDDKLKVREKKTTPTIIQRKRRKPTVADGETNSEQPS